MASFRACRSPAASRAAAAIRVSALLLAAASARGHECGARREVVDLGANDGRGIAELEPLTADALLTAVTAFEMNPGFESILRGKLARFPGGELVQAAAWTHARGIDAELQLPGQLSAVRGGRNVGRPDNATGSSVVVGGVPLNARSKCGKAAWCSAGTRRAHVASVDLAAWLRARVCAADVLVVKLDIEGGEWELLAHVIEQGAAGLIDHLAVEWHVAQRSAGDAAERHRLLASQRALETKLAEAGVRMLRSWDAGALHGALAAPLGSPRLFAASLTSAARIAQTPAGR